MIPYGLFSQIGLIVISVAIIFTYIKPLFTEVASTQEKIETYQQEIKKVAQVNETLDGLVEKLEAVSQADQLRLLTYIPDTVDTVAVPRDILNIANEAGVILKSVEYEGSLSTAEVDLTLPNSANLPEPHVFSVNVESSYGQIKNFISLLEKNHYPLEVHELSIARMSGGFLDAQFKLVTYDRELPVSLDIE